MPGSRKPSKDAAGAIKLLKKLFRIKFVKRFILISLLVLLAPFVVFFILRPKVQKDIEYGITFSNKYASELGLEWKQAYLQILDGLNVKNIRLIAYWDEIESERDLYDFSNIKWQLEEAEKRGLNVILTIGRKVPRWPECFEPGWWKGVESEAEQRRELYAFIEKGIKELAKYDSISMWQVENEPFFPFGECVKTPKSVVRGEIELVKSLDDRPILVQDSGEGGFWFPSYEMGDYLAISMYRKIWYDFWGVFFGRFIYFQYPLAHWTYKIKAGLVGVPYQKVIVTELQAEPWGPGINSSLSKTEKDKSMSREDFLATISYAQKAGFKDLYLWGVEWWLWEKEKNNNPYFWDTAKAIFN